eukprot:COSAG01_NODE_1474_length_10192_cov_7.027742_1_plen_450_part_00
MYSLMVKTDENARQYEECLKKAEDSLHADSLAAAYRDAIQSARNAYKQKQSIKNLLESLEILEQSGTEDASALARPEAASTWARLRRAVGRSELFLFVKRLLVICSYVGIFTGVMLVCNVQTSGEPWTATEAVYFSVVTMSTVGYGDYSPLGTPAAEAWTAVFIFIGVLVVFQFAGGMYDQIFHYETGIVARVLKRLCANMHEKCRGCSSEENASLDPLWKFYLLRLAPGAFFGILINIFLFAGFFVAVQPELSYKKALWHCYVTATTVGYGDVKLEHETLILAAVHILVSVSWLSSTASQFIAALEQRKHDEQREAALKVKLTAAKIRDLKKFALPAPDISMMDPQDDEDGVNQWGFVLGELVAQGAQLWGQPLTFDNQIADLVKQFKKYDDDGSGKLTKRDLAGMVSMKQLGTGAAHHTAQESLCGKCRRRSVPISTESRQGQRTLR